MDLFNISKKKLDIKDKISEPIEIGGETTAKKAKKAMDDFNSFYPKPPIVGKIFDTVTEVAKTGVDTDEERKFRIYKEIKDKGILEETKSVYQITDADIREFEKRLQEEENEKRLKEQQMDKNLTSPTSSLTKPVMLASSNSVATDGFVDYGVSKDTFSTLQIANESNDKFIVTRADIYENLESIFSIECFTYINLVKTRFMKI